MKQALVIPDVSPREAEFCALYAAVRWRLAALGFEPLLAEEHQSGIL